ncbi:hypothetical protein CF15_00525 [Pyrodictium occultum]|uniref:Uncharacterized protein n=1 Tax=Pyrodictium occultum TaxID=2309 RepID=A0A0V8RTK3_PYROC|nr:hypothetical protein [Pyrodictium occultum]KSW11385.1 hypothetical protein CF15_00525 [Pyrodictium occultum]
MPREQLADTLKKTGVCRKVVEVEESSECILLYCSDEDGMLIAAASYYDWVYAKTVAEGAIKPHMWHCSDVFYTPYGLYSFSKNVEELARKIAEKKPLVYAQMRMALEKLAAVEE